MSTDVFLLLLLSMIEIRRNVGFGNGTILEKSVGRRTRPIYAVLTLFSSQ